MSWQKRLTRRLMLALIPPLAEKWMRWFDYTALKNNEALLTLIDEAGLVDRVRRREPTILAIWHNRLIFGPTAYMYCNGHGAVVMVSRSFDGELIAATIRRFQNIQAVRGSSASKKGRDKGGQDALAEMIEYGRKGYDLVITPDGPQGPRYQAKRGIVELARATGFPIIPVSANASRVIHAKSWDQTIFPFPYAYFVYRVGKPITVPGDADEEMLESKRQEVERALQELTDFVDHFFDHGIPRKGK